MGQKLPLITVGIENELMVLDKRGFIANSAPYLLRNAPDWLVKEATLANIEINSPPCTDIRTLAEKHIEQLSIVETLAKRYSVQIIPASEFGAGEGLTRQRLTQREKAYRIVFPRWEEFMTRKYLGTHIHTSRIKEKEIVQGNMHIALDIPSFVITANSAIDYLGRHNNVTNNRIGSLRQGLFGQTSQTHTRVEPYFQRSEEIERRQIEGLEQWVSIAPQNKRNFVRGQFHLDDTGYQSPRFRTKFPTWEGRSADSTLPSRLFGLAALHLGVQRRVVREGLPVLVNGDSYSFSSNGVILPSYEKLMEFQHEGIRDGVKSNQVAEYINAIREFAEAGLEQGDQAYLLAIDDVLNNGSPSAQMRDFLREQFGDKAQYSSHEAAAANLWMRDKYVQELKHFQQYFERAA